MSEGQNHVLDFMILYERYQKLKPGPQAELKRVAQPDDLLEIPAFYRLLHDARAGKDMQRLVYCLPLITHQESGDSLGKALAKAEINEKRLFMVIRSEEPNDLIQLRRLLKQSDKPKVDWIKMAKTIWNWNRPDLRVKQKLLEDFFLNQHTKK
ncbi:type I-E CRISPR-associated protein Cse2/CasB [Methylomonas lenta]|uniref:Type I-E CRISPR-associated protein Cse2/CasB n=1 Tax=Methylomonas lenta TaxID=980561 RepID=A0A177NRG5_9GAMM|nr:type I-E CRISPR-associated protein Cse2/CasB [Methylomonas lenta]OAI20658.1 type I-E CRISPR-associated protein Cse2/CasB [Methylomonas lenta]